MSLEIKLDKKEDEDLEEVDKIISVLYEELKEIDIFVDRKNIDKAMNGAKSGLPIDPLSLIITGITIAGSIASIIGVVQSWRDRNNLRKITLKINDNEINVNGTSNKDQKKLIENWINQQLNQD